MPPKWAKAGRTIFLKILYTLNLVKKHQNNSKTSSTEQNKARVPILDITSKRFPENSPWAPSGGEFVGKAERLHQEKSKKSLKLDCSSGAVSSCHCTATAHIACARPRLPRARPACSRASCMICLAILSHTYTYIHTYMHTYRHTDIHRHTCIQYIHICINYITLHKIK